MPRYGRNIHMFYIETIVDLVKRNKKVDILTVSNRLGITPFYLKYVVLKTLSYHPARECIEMSKEAGLEYLVWVCE